MRNELCREEHEIYIDFLPKKLFDMDCLLADVVREKEYAARLLYTEHFMNGSAYLFF